MTDPAPNRERVTVVVPTYNRRESLARCLRALLACDVEGVEVELRIVDDGSSDGTGEMVEQLRSGYSGPIRIRYKFQDNGGVAAARNAAIRAAETDLVLFTDDDCEPEPGWVNALVRARWAPETGAVGGRIVSRERGTRVARYCRYLRFNEFPPDEEPIRFVNTANCAYRRRVLEEAGGFETDLAGGGEDHDLAWRIVREGYGLEYQPAAVVLHHHREDLRTLLRTFWSRGYAGTLRDVLWGVRPAPAAHTVRQERRLLLRDGLEAAALPLRAARLVRRGVARRDAVPFACYEWLRRLSNRRGRIAMLQRIVDGRQPLARTTSRPGTGGPALQAGGR